MLHTCYITASDVTPQMLQCYKLNSEIINKINVYHPGMQVATGKDVRRGSPW